MHDDIQLIYVHDPMCSWCWGFRPAFQQLCDALPSGIRVGRLLGGLAPDSDQPMPQELQLRLQDTWRRIEQHIPGTRFNFDFWQRCAARRSTWRACRAVIVARTLDPASEDAMILAVQRAYYLRAENPSDRDTLVSIARQLGLDCERFAASLDADSTQLMLDTEMIRARELGANSFPSLRLQIAGSAWPISVDYTDADAMLNAITQLTG